MREAMDPSPVVCGIYMLFRQHRLVYTGRSKDCYRRIATHRTNGREFDYAIVSSVPEADTAWVERALVDATQPAQNKQMKSIAPASQPYVVTAPIAAPVAIAVKEQKLRPVISKAEVMTLCRDRGFTGAETEQVLGADCIKRFAFGRPHWRSGRVQFKYDSASVIAAINDKLAAKFAEAS